MRIIIVGPNHSGRTTFARTLIGNTITHLIDDERDPSTVGYTNWVIVIQNIEQVAASDRASATVIYESIAESNRQFRVVGGTELRP